MTTFKFFSTMFLITMAGAIFYNFGKVKAVSIDSYNTAKFPFINIDANPHTLQYEEGIIDEPINKSNPIELNTIVVRPTNIGIENPININNPIELKTVTVVPEVAEFVLTDPINKNNPIQLRMVTVTAESIELAGLEQLDINELTDLSQLIAF